MRIHDLLNGRGKAEILFFYLGGTPILYTLMIQMLANWQQLFQARVIYDITNTQFPLERGEASIWRDVLI